jgi:hypothetical protein
MAEKTLISFLCWNRLGLTSRNLEALLKTDEDFDLYIVDNNSQDDTFEYLKNLSDPRIKKIVTFSQNYGAIYATNFVLSKRKKNQNFMNIDNDVCINSKSFIKNNIDTIKEFPELGVLGNVRSTYFDEYPAIKKQKIERNNKTVYKTDYIMGSNMFFPYKIMDKLGYFNESGFGDTDISHRLRILNKWMGFTFENNLDSKQTIPCDSCLAKNLCRDPENKICFNIYKKNYKHKENNLCSILEEVSKNISYENGNVYCGSTHDLKSQTKGFYSKEDSEKVFNYFKNNSN